MKNLNYVLHPTFGSIKRLIFWIGIFCALLSIGGLLCIAQSPRGIDLHALKIFVGIPFGYIFLPVLLISFSYRITINNDRIVFYMFFLPVKMIDLETISKVFFEKIASNGQPCVITIRYKNEKYSYPIRLFDKSKIEQLITDLNDISDKKTSHSEVIDSSIFDFSKKNTIKNFIRFICILFIILLFILLFKK